MTRKYFKLIVNLIILAGLIASLINEDKLMAIFFVTAMILSEMEDIHDTLKRKNDGA